MCLRSFLGLVESWRLIESEVLAIEAEWYWQSTPLVWVSEHTAHTSSQCGRRKNTCQQETSPEPYAWIPDLVLVSPIHYRMTEHIGLTASTLISFTFTLTAGFKVLLLFPSTRDGSWSSILRSASTYRCTLSSAHIHKRSAVQITEYASQQHWPHTRAADMTKHAIKITSPRRKISPKESWVKSSDFPGCVKLLVRDHEDGN